MLEKSCKCRSLLSENLEKNTIVNLKVNQEMCQKVHQSVILGDFDYLETNTDLALHPSRAKTEPAHRASERRVRLR